MPPYANFSARPEERVRLVAGTSGQNLRAAADHDRVPRAGQGGVEQLAGQQRQRLLGQEQQDLVVLGALRFVHSQGIGQGQALTQCLGRDCQPARGCLRSTGETQPWAGLHGRPL